ncbi:SCP-like protein, partial [Teladorsagia circumcincta]
MLGLLALICTVLTVITGSTAASCPSNNGMTDEVRQIFVDRHNKYRSLVARGLAKDRFGRFAPKAARMLKVSYDCEVEANMMSWAKRCVFEHSPSSERHKWGQNLYMSSETGGNKAEAAAAAVDSWFHELAESHVPHRNRFTKRILYKLGHYTQVVWQSSNKIGCAVEWCPDMTLVGCEYKP